MVFIAVHFIMQLFLSVFNHYTQLQSCQQVQNLFSFGNALDTKLRDYLSSDTTAQEDDISTKKCFKMCSKRANNLKVAALATY